MKVVLCDNQKERKNNLLLENTQTSSSQTQITQDINIIITIIIKEKVVLKKKVMNLMKNKRIWVATIEA